VFALLVLPIVLLVGLATVLRLADANTDDVGLVVGMNRLRHAYLELAPELEPYFVTDHYDDLAGIRRSYGAGYHFNLGRILSATPNVVGALNVVVIGVLAALVATTLGATETATVAVGVIAALAAVVGIAAVTYRRLSSERRAYRPRFPR
jgi:uncharacterized membrane protein YuzA (DUF378 family)